MTQQQRRSNPYPWAWEIPAAAVTTVVLVFAFGVHLGRAVANLSAGAGWHVPDRADLFRSLPGVLQGHADAGLHLSGEAVASPPVLWSCVAVTELMLTAVMVTALVVILNTWGPRRLQGMASRSEAEQLMGVTRLRRDRAVVRPDLYGEGTP